jgi:peptidoglycan/LPS O-acetylase OafA/YrhL
LRRVSARTLDLLVALVTEFAAAVAIAWLLYELVIQWARLTGRM